MRCYDYSVGNFLSSNFLLSGYLFRFFIPLGVLIPFLLLIGIIFLLVNLIMYSITGSCFLSDLFDEIDYSLHISESVKDIKDKRAHDKQEKLENYEKENNCVSFKALDYLKIDSKYAWDDIFDTIYFLFDDMVKACDNIMKDIDTLCKSGKLNFHDVTNNTKNKVFLVDNIDDRTDFLGSYKENVNYVSTMFFTLLMNGDKNRFGYIDENEITYGNNPLTRFFNGTIYHGFTFL